MTKVEKLSDFLSPRNPHFEMINIARKRPTHRYAIACGTIFVGKEAFQHLKQKTLPKGDPLALSEIAGISGAKKTADLIPLCHTLPLDQVLIHQCLNEEDYSITVYCQVAAFAKTGVEMEALSGVTTALLTIWDLIKAVTPNLMIANTKLLVKMGGKNGIWKNPEGIPDWITAQLPQEYPMKAIKAGIIVMSDRASCGDYEDQSGVLLKDLLQNSGATIVHYEVIPDDAQRIKETLQSLQQERRPDLIITAGGTGPGLRDVTPNVLEQICHCMLEGIGDFLRRESLYFTDTAWLSRMTAGMLGSTLVIAFPGSPKAVKECWDILSPFIGDSLMKIRKQGFEVVSK